MPRFFLSCIALSAILLPSRVSSVEHLWQEHLWQEHLWQEHLWQRIDQLIEASYDGEPAELSSDAEFFRCLNLDLAGRIPTAGETRHFLSDAAPDKRQAAIDRLVNSPAFAERMADLFHVMLMEGRGENDEWHAFLRNSFAENRPWDQLVREILRPNRETEKTHSAAFFFTKRLDKVGQQIVDFAGLTRDVGRMFLGVDLQCAECHDHLTWQRSSRCNSGDPPSRETYRVSNQRLLTAEQLFCSMLQATGKLERLAPCDAGAATPEFKEFRSAFFAAFASEPKEPAIDHAPAVKQALFLLNDSKMLELLSPKPGNLVHRLLALPDVQIADELFLCIFCRFPDSDERAMVLEFLKEHPSERSSALRHLAWAMLASMEFAVNH